MLYMWAHKMTQDGEMWQGQQVFLCLVLRCDRS
jgi:hypothetical protein